MIVSLHTDIYPYSSVFFKIQADTIPIWFGIIIECRVDLHAKPGRGVFLFFGMLPTYNPSRYVEHLFGTYQNHYIASVSGNIYVS